MQDLVWCANELKSAWALNDKYREFLLDIKGMVETCDWSCDRCGKDQKMKETDLYEAARQALAEGNEK